MSKNEEEVVEKDDDVEETEDDVVEDKTEDDVVEEETTDWKAKFKKEEGRRKRAETKLSKPPSKPSKELDYGKKAFLVANGIKGSKETELVEKIASDTGKTIEQVLESKYFQAELNEIRELDKTDNALPKGSKRTGQSTKDTVDYWIAKGELPTDRKLRQDVVNARIKKETDKSVFE